MRTILVLTGLLAVGAVPVSGAAQHGATPAPSAHAAPPAHGAPPAHAATAAKAAAKPAGQPVEKSPASTHETGPTHGTTSTPPSAKAVAAPAAGAKHDTKAVAESKPAAKADTPGTHEGKASDKTPAKAAAAARKGAPFSDLEAAFDRIAQKIDGAEVMPGGLRISSGSAVAPAPARAAEGRPAETHAGRSEATPRVRLIWRSSVVWPATLAPAETHDTAPAHQTSRIALAWP